MTSRNGGTRKRGPRKPLAVDVGWETLEKNGAYTLQKHRLSGECRILDEKRRLVVQGQEHKVRTEMWMLGWKSKMQE